MADADAFRTTQDAFFGGRLILEQPSRGHRSGTDAVLLAAAAPRDFAGFVLDAGAGVGAAGFGIAITRPAARVGLIENDPGSLELASSNIARNGLGDRVASMACDLLSRKERQASLPKKADLVVTNPPFYEAGQVRASPDAGRRAAHVMAGDATLADWISACLDCLTGNGMIVVVHAATAVPSLLRALEGRAGALTLMSVHPRVGEPARRVLLRATKGSRAPFAIARPLALHRGDAFTAEADALHRGEPLDW